MIDWIKTSDRKPENESKVLVNMERYDYTCCAYYYADEDAWILCQGDDNVEAMYPVTYWAPYNSPEEEE